MKKLNKKGFTLVELLAVIVVLALLMVVAASSIGNALSNAKKNTLKTEAQKVLSAAYQDIKSQIMLTGSAKDLEGIKTIGAASVTYSYYGTEGSDYTYSVMVDNAGTSITEICVNYKNSMSIRQDFTDTNISTSSLVPKLEDDTNVIESGKSGYCSIADTGVITTTS